MTNWYKKAQSIEENTYYTSIGHKGDSDLDTIWISDLNGNNFHMEKPDNYDHRGFAYDIGLNEQIGTIQGRYDSVKNIVSIKTDPSIVTMREFPNRLINRLYQEFGNNITILDYTQGTPKVVV